MGAKEKRRINLNVGSRRKMNSVHGSTSVKLGLTNTEAQIAAKEAAAAKKSQSG